MVFGSILFQKVEEKEKPILWKTFQKFVPDFVFPEIEPVLLQNLQKEAQRSGLASGVLGRLGEKLAKRSEVRFQLAFAPDEELLWGTHPET